MTEPDAALLDALRGACERDPANGPLWLHYGEQLARTTRAAEAIAALRKAADLRVEPPLVLRHLLPLLREAGFGAEALIRAEQCLERHDDPFVRRELATVLREQGEDAAAATHYRAARAADPALAEGSWDAWAAAFPDAVLPKPAALPTPTPAPVRAGAAPEAATPAELLERFETEEPAVKFADVAGLAEVKEQIELRIVAPYKTPEIFAAFGRKAGGGVLLYGPPGTGKTFIARATAGEVGARFVAMGVADLVDAFWGESEKAIRELFAQARRNAPTVLFFDEFDALGASRGGTESQFWRALVTQLLQEMDGISGPNEGVLVMAATNLPWSVDPAFRRPGRFDRVVFVPPPDEAARRAILTTHAASLPGGESVDVAKLAAKTANWSGADLKALCERACEGALARSLKTGKVQPVAMDDFTRALGESRASAGEWFATARNHVRYANEGGRYDDLEAYMKQNKLL